MKIKHITPLRFLMLKLNFKTDSLIGEIPTDKLDTEHHEMNALWISHIITYVRVPRKPIANYFQHQDGLYSSVYFQYILTPEASYHRGLWEDSFISYIGPSNLTLLNYYIYND